jgi:hypothetical protein
MAERSGLDEPSASGRIALRLLAALAGVGLAADRVHGLGQRRVRLVADGAEGHGTGGEALDDLGGGLDLVEGTGSSAHLKSIRPRKVSSRSFCSLIRREYSAKVRRVGAGRVLELGDGLGRPDVILAAQPEGVVAADIQVLAQDLLFAIAAAMPEHGLARDLGQADALDHARGAGEVAATNSLFKPTASKICAPQ